MHKLIAGLAAATFAAAAWACTVSTITVNGRTMTCMTCCSGNYCQTNCY